MVISLRALFGTNVILMMNGNMLSFKNCGTLFKFFVTFGIISSLEQCGFCSRIF